MQTEIETDAIVLQVMSGHREAFGELVERYQVDVWRVLVAVLNDGAVTEDLVQQTFVNAFEHLDQYQPGRDFGLWIKTIARNLARNELRRRSREHSNLTRYWSHLRDRIENPFTDEAGGNLLLDALEHCRRALPEAMALVVDRRYSSGETLEEMARQMGRSVEGLKKTLLRARILLRACAEKELRELQ